MDICTSLDPQFKPVQPDESVIEKPKEEMLYSHTVFSVVFEVD